MKAIHVNWTAPFFERHRLRGHGFKITRNLEGQTYDLTDYQILYTLVSALRWKLHNGPIKLYTDSIGLSFYKQIGMDGVYDEINVDVLNNVSDVDPAYFWTSGKIQAIGHETEPFVFIDQDFIVREKFDESRYNADLMIGHWEIPRGQYYFTESDWTRDIKHMPFPENYNVYAYAPNTSFVYFGNMQALQEYVNWHKQMIKTDGIEVPEWFWLATDQGIFGHVIREGKYVTDSLTDKVFLADNEYGTKETQKFGHSEMWYYPMECDKSKDDFDYVNRSPWEHVWLAKILCGIDPSFMERETQRYFDEAWFHGGKEFLTHPRFTKYWNKERHGL